jgi:hypothetical protein
VYDMWDPIVSGTIYSKATTTQPNKLFQKSRSIFHNCFFESHSS